MYVLHWFLKYPHFSRMESCLCLWRIQSLKGTKWVQNPFQKPICYKQELTQVFSSVSVQFNHSVVSNSLLPHGLQHTRPPYPITNSRSLLKLMSIESVMPSHHLSLFSPAFNLSQHQNLFKWVSFSHHVAKVLEFQHHSFQWIFKTDPLGWTAWISLQSKGHSRVFSNTTVQKHQFFSPFLIVQLSHPYITTGKTITLTRMAFVGKVISLLFNTLSRLVITFLPRSKHLLISWL